MIISFFYPLDIDSTNGWVEKNYGNVTSVWEFITLRVVRASVVTGPVIGWLASSDTLSWWAAIWLKNVWYSCLNLCTDPITAGREGGFHSLYKVGFIGCGRLIKSLTLELRWGVKAGDKGIDKEAWFFFFCLCVCVWMCLFWALAHIPQILRGQRGELDWDYSDSAPCSCQSQRNTSCTERVWKWNEMCRKARGDDERDTALLKRFHVSDDTLSERWN